MAKSRCSRQARPNTNVPMPSIQAPRSSRASHSNVARIREFICGRNVATRGFREKIHFAAVRPTTGYAGSARAFQRPGQPAYAIAHLESVECRKSEQEPARVWRREGKSIERQRFDPRL